MLFMVEAFSWTLLSSQFSYPADADVLHVVLLINAHAASGLLPTFCLCSSYHFFRESAENLLKKSEKSPENGALGPNDFGGMMTIFGSVKSLFVSSSVWRVTQSMIYSGNPDMRRFWTFMISCTSRGFAVSIPISIEVPEVPPFPRLRSGHPRFVLRAPRRERVV
jgi:hypothetical protein